MTRTYEHVVAAETAERRMVANELRAMALVLMKHRPTNGRGRRIWKRQAERMTARAAEIEER